VLELKEDVKNMASQIFPSGFILETKKGETRGINMFFSACCVIYSGGSLCTTGNTL
jgi:hypothetical protein